VWNLRDLFHRGEVKENKEDRGHRKFRRISVILSINCSLSGNQFRIMTDNVSFCGIRYLSPLELPVDGMVDLSILLSSHMPALQINAKVAGCEKVEAKGRTLYAGIIEFGPLKDNEQRIWENYVKRYETEDDPFKNAA